MWDSDRDRDRGRGRGRGRDRDMSEHQTPGFSSRPSVSESARF